MCWRSYANGSNIVTLRLGDQATKASWKLLTEKFDRFQTLRNNIQQHVTGCANERNM